MIGCGAWGESYLRTLITIPDIKLTYVCDLNQHVLQKVNSLSSQIKVVEDYHALLDDKRLNAVIIATPPPSHYQIAADCLMCGKAVLIEKPMTTNLEDAEKLVRLGEKKGQVLMTGHLMKYHPAVKVLKEYIAQGRFGEIRFLNFERTNFNYYRQDVNVLWDLAVHDLTVLNYLIESDPNWLWAKGNSWRQDLPLGTALVSLGFENGLLAQIHADWHYYKKSRHFAVVGTKMTAVFDDTEDYEHKLLLIESNSKRCYLQVPCTEPLYLQCSHFIDCVRSNKLPLSAGRNALKIMNMIELTEKSLHNNQVIYL